MPMKKSFFFKLPLMIGAFMILMISIRIKSETVDSDKSIFIEQPENYPYINPVPGEIAIIASSPWIGKKVPAAEEMRAIRECGFNCVLSLATVSYFKKVEPLMKEVGLKAIMGFPEFEQDSGRDVVNLLKGSEVIGGWRVTDEPNEKDFGQIFKRYENIVQADTNHLAYINLVGPGNPSFYGDCSDYNSFLMKYQQVFHPSVLSYDMYPVSIKDGKIKVDYYRFYEALETYY